MSVPNKHARKRAYHSLSGRSTMTSSFQMHGINNPSLPGPVQSLPSTRTMSNIYRGWHEKTPPSPPLCHFPSTPQADHHHAHHTTFMTVEYACATTNPAGPRYRTTRTQEVDGNRRLLPPTLTMDAPEVVSGPVRSLSHMLRRQQKLQIPPPVHSSPVTGRDESVYEFYTSKTEDDKEPLKTPTRPRSTILVGRRKRIIVGLSLIIVILVAAIGGGIGGSLAANARRASDPSPMIVMMPTTITMMMMPTAGIPGPTPKTTPTPTSTSSPNSTSTSSSTSTADVQGKAADAIIKVPTQGVVEFDCGKISMSRQLVTLGTLSWGFDVNCMMDYAGPGVDLAGMTAYSFGDCIRACAMFNNFARNNTCLGVFFNANLTTSLPMNNGNCFLKSYLPQMSPEMDLAAAASLASSPLF